MGEGILDFGLIHLPDIADLVAATLHRVHDALFALRGDASCA